MEINRIIRLLFTSLTVNENNAGLFIDSLLLCSIASRIYSKVMAIWHVHHAHFDIDRQMQLIEEFKARVFIYEWFDCYYVTCHFIEVCKTAFRHWHERREESGNMQRRTCDHFTCHSSQLCHLQGSLLLGILDPR